MRKIHFRKH